MTTCFIEGASEGGEGQEIWVQNVGRTGIKTSERTGGWGEANGAKPRWMSPPYEDTSGTITFTRAQYRAPARRDLIRRPIVVKSPPARNI